MNLAVIRPDSWNLPLFVHVFGASVLVGALFTVALCLFLGWKGANSAGMTRLGLKTVLFGTLPAYIVMRGGGEWLAGTEHLDKLTKDPAWLGIGYGVADASALGVVIAAVLAAVGLQKLKGVDASSEVALKTARVTAVLASVLMLAGLLAMWAMATKPA